jgi:hypothetical protein
MHPRKFEKNIRLWLPNFISNKLVQFQERYLFSVICLIISLKWCRRNWAMATAFLTAKIEKWEMDKSPEPLYFFPPFFFFPLAALATILTS